MKIQVNTSYGVFEVKYSDYDPGWKGSYDEPPEPPSVDILDISFVNPETEYDYSMNELWDNPDFISQIESSTIESIQESYRVSVLNAKIMEWESDFCDWYARRYR